MQLLHKSAIAYARLEAIAIFLQKAQRKNLIADHLFNYQIIN
ncbi:hypothetical protein [uncultured Nostoc sp.]